MVVVIPSAQILSATLSQALSHQPAYRGFRASEPKVYRKKSLIQRQPFCRSASRARSNTPPLLSDAEGCWLADGWQLST